MDLASSWDGNTVAQRVLREGPVEVWDVETRQKVSVFPTVLASGGRRLAISGNGQRVAAASYGPGGVAMYDVARGTSIWQRPDITRVQDLLLMRRGTCLCAVRDGAAATLIDAMSGRTIRKEARVSWWCEDRRMDRSLLFDGRSYRLLDETTRPLADMVDAGPLDGAFGDNVACVSEVAGVLRCFTIADGREIWRIKPPEGTHWTALAYVEGLHCFAVVRYEYETGGQVLLELFDPATGQFREVSPLRHNEHVFCGRGALILGSDGELRRTSDGELEHDFDWFAQYR